MSVRAPRRIATILAVPTALAAGVALVAPLAQAAPSAHEGNYKGSAFAVSANVKLTGTDLLDEVLPSIVQFPEGAVDNILEIPVDGVLDLKVGEVGSGLEDGTLVSKASVTNFAVLENVVTAGVLASRCTAKDTNVEGDSQVADLALAGMKIPVDTGPNTEIAIPEALSALLSGGITIDEQTTLDDGGVRIRALHLNISINLLAIPEALASVDAVLRTAAETLKDGVEAATGQSLDQLLGTLGVADPKAAPAAKKAESTKQKGAQAAPRQELRTDAAAPVQAEAPVEAEAPVQAEQVEAPATPAAAETAETSAAAEKAEKADGAVIDRDGAAEQAATAPDDESTALDPRAEYAAEAEADADDTTEQDAGLDPRAEYAAEVEAPPADAAGEDAAATDAAIESQPAAAAEQAQPQQGVGAETAAKNTRDAAAPRSATDLPQVLPNELPDTGLLGVQVIISEVQCTGAEPPAPVVVQEEPEAKPEALPKSGGNGPLAQNLALSALGLMVVGGSAIYLTRRRGQHAA